MGPLISTFSLQLRLNQLFFLKMIFKMKLAVSLFVVSFLALVTTTQTESSDYSEEYDSGPVFDPCSAPMDAGPCKESKASFYFDKSSMSCKICMYVSCGGNGNNFRKKSDCLRAYKLQIVEAEKAVEDKAVKKVEEAVEEEVEEAVKEEAVQEE